MPHLKEQIRRLSQIVAELTALKPKPQENINEGARGMLLSELSQPLRDLLSSKSHWSWSDAQQQAFTALKESLTSTPTLAH